MTTGIVGLTVHCPAKVKVLFISNLFPDASEPNRGLVNARLLRHLARLAEIRVVAPRPALSGWWTQETSRSPLKEDAALSPRYPLVPYVPKFGSQVNDWLYAKRLQSILTAVRKDYAFDVILCSWLYPDAAAVARLADQFHFPYVAIAQGSDVHQYLDVTARRQRIVATVNRSSATVARSRELARLLSGAGADSGKIQVIYNGVETDVFNPGDKQAAREALGLSATAKLILYVGNLLHVKNPGLALESLAKLQAQNPQHDTRLIMIGAGPLAESLRQQAATLGLADQVSWTGAQPPAQVAQYLRAGDVLCLPSLNEGMPNVLLEAMATGRPVVATNVGGISEVLNRPALGRVVPSRDSASMAAALNDVLTTCLDENTIAQSGRAYSWAETAQSYHKLLVAALGATGRADK